MLTEGGNTLTYDAENRIVSASSTAALSITRTGRTTNGPVRQLTDGTYDITIYGVQGEAVGSFTWSPSVGPSVETGKRLVWRPPDRAGRRNAWPHAEEPRAGRPGGDEPAVGRVLPALWRGDDFYRE
jgi:hypothetical protein